MTNEPHRRDDALLGVLPMSDQARTDLARRMSEPSRHYHTMRHLDLMWTRHRRYGRGANLVGNPIETPIALAIAYHDAVYIGGATDNEERSAALWLDVSATGVPVDETDRLWIADTIRATAAHFDAARGIDLRDPRGQARQWVLDLDLTPLGEVPEVFDENTRLLAAELPHLTIAQQHASLLDSLRYFAAARPLFRCHAIADAFEAPAHRNFARWLNAVDAHADRIS